MFNKNNSIIFEADTVAWIDQLKKRGYKIETLADLPDQIFEEFAAMGIKFLWLLGIFEESSAGKKLAYETKILHSKYNECLPGWTKEDIKSSPYAIKSYKVAKKLGGDEALEKLRKRLKKKYDIGIILDFVPNHLAIDHPVIEYHPEYFVQGGEKERAIHHDGYFEKEIGGKKYLFAHGKDPYFPPWKDTIQLDYRNPDVHLYMEKELLALAEKCDGVRCDMSMLILNDIFHKTWDNEYLPPKVIPRGKEFWYTAISKVKKEHPEFIFIAEVYWGKEKELLDLGFDFVYDKFLYDCILHRGCSDIKNYIQSVFSSERSRIVFTENHDEPRIASLVSRQILNAASTCIFTLPTMKLIYNGQLAGFKIPHAIQLKRFADEEDDADIVRFYKKLFRAINESSISDGYFKMLHPKPAWETSLSHKNFLIYLYENDDLKKDLVVINTSEFQSQCRVVIDSYDVQGKDFLLVDRLSDKKYLRNGTEMATIGLYLDLEPYETHIFSFEKPEN